MPCEESAMKVREVELLRCCMRTRMDSSWAAQLRALAREDIDWNYLLETANNQRVTPLLYWQLNAVCPEGVPRDVLDDLHHHFRVNSFKNVFLTHKLVDLLNLFRAHGIPAIPFKGPALAVSVYGNLALRQFGDLDILVRKPDYERTQRLLTDQGFRRRAEFENEIGFNDPSGRVVVDLHWRLAALDFPSPLSFDYLWKRLQT